MRNPFKIRASQRSVNDEEFVRLFGAGALQLLESTTDPWDGLIFLRSAPGGGKTTLLRLLSPRPLKLAARLADTSPQVKATSEALREIGALGESDGLILGAMVVFTTEYRDLAEIDRANSLFRALLNSRIVIATLRAVLERSERSFPDDLAQFDFEWVPESDATIPAKASGAQLFRWASEIERGFYERMDDLGEPASSTGGHARLDGLKWFARSEISERGAKVNVKRVLLFDELQTLALSQRDSLRELIVNARESCGVWIAERLEALNHRELLSEGALEDRDYDSVIQLERRWAGAAIKSYSKFVEQIATVRASKADGFEDRNFFSLISEREDPAIWDHRFLAAAKIIEGRVGELAKGARYSTWVDDARQASGTPFDRALKWRATEILVTRDMRRPQTSFDFDALTAEEFSKREKGVERAAEHFLRIEMSAPVYFGKDALAQVSSANVEQYIEVAGELFEEVSAKITGPRADPMPLSVERQDHIIRAVAEKRWEGLVRRLPRGPEARRLLSAVGEYCQFQTFRPTAPYSPGVTGFAITMADRKFLFDSADADVKHFAPLRDVLTSLVAHNLLVPRVDHQHTGKSYVVFYLNRLLCVRFQLPLGFGGWRERSLKELHAWMETGNSNDAAKEAKLV